MEFDWILFLSISILGPFLGSRLCADLEKRITGEVRREIEFKKKRVKSTLISIALGYIMAGQLIGQVRGKIFVESELSIRLLSIMVGVAVYLLFQRVSYWFMLRNY